MMTPAEKWKIPESAATYRPGGRGRLEDKGGKGAKHSRLSPPSPMVPTHLFMPQAVQNMDGLEDAPTNMELETMREQMKNLTTDLTTLRSGLDKVADQVEKADKTAEESRLSTNAAIKDMADKAARETKELSTNMMSEMAVRQQTVLQNLAEREEKTDASMQMMMTMLANHMAEMRDGDAGELPQVHMEMDKEQGQGSGNDSQKATPPPSPGRKNKTKDAMSASPMRDPQSPKERDYRPPKSPPAAAAARKTTRAQGSPK